VDGVSWLGRARLGQRCRLGMKGMEDMRISKARGVGVGRRMNDQDR